MVHMGFENFYSLVLVFYIPLLGWYIWGLKMLQWFEDNAKIFKKTKNAIII